MKRLFLVTLFLSFFGFTSAFAYDTCDANNPFIPCTYNSYDFDSYIGNDNQVGIFFNACDINILDYHYSNNTQTQLYFKYPPPSGHYSIAFLPQWPYEDLTLYYWGITGGWEIYHNGEAIYSQTVTGYLELGGGINPSKTLSIIRSPQLGGGVRVTVPPGFPEYQCGVDSQEECDFEVDFNAQVTLEAEANSGYAFSHWEINSQTMGDTDGTIPISMSEDKEVVGVFKKTFTCTNGSFQNTSGTGGWCVDYVNSETGINLSGNASAWWQGAIDAGYVTGSDPAISAIVVLDDSSLAYGHVGIVTDFNETTIWVQDSNWADPYDFQIRNHTLSRSRSDISGYIYCTPQN